MSIVSMSKLSVIAHTTEKARLLRTLIALGCVETVKTEPLEFTGYFSDEETKSQIQSKLIKLNFALTFLRETAKDAASYDKKTAKPVDMKKINELISIDAFEDVAKNDQEVFAKVSALEKVNGKLVDLKTEKQRLLSLEEQLRPYENLEIKFSSVKDTDAVKIYVGLVPIASVPSLIEKLPDTVLMEHYDSDKTSAIAVVAHVDEQENVRAILASLDFSRCTFDYDCTAKDKLEEIAARKEEIDKERHDVIVATNGNSADVRAFKILYDYYYLEMTKLDVAADCAGTESAFVLTGWCPTGRQKEVEDAITKKCKCAEVSFRAPLDSELPPTMTKNPKPVAAFDGITSMFGVPNYREKDPNLFVAFFYFLFFGIMLGDAGYGLLMILGILVFLRMKKPVKNSGQMMVMFGLCGVSMVLWGVLLGGWFGINLAPGSFLYNISWFLPLEEPLKMFMLALGMGVLQIGTGFALKGIAEIKAGHPVHAIFNQFSWVIIFIGLCFISPTLMAFLGAISFENGTPHAVTVCSKIGLFTALAGFVMLLVGGAIGKKNPLKMVTGAFGNAYGAINVVSDLLSYSRLFGLGLTSVVIGYVVNMLADIIVNTFLHGLWVGWIIAIPVLVIGHVFNLAINLLGAYVHNSRLQYIEFFGRFYEGSGRAFAPLGTKTKYIYLDN